ncbi:hypothetical protein GCM10007989_27570 [Devosia pacifica]|uniref:Uncharacterized protein n=1 Tax=Devosia pacifica TaxID=1335967 RepID=A0A918VUK5_9HYPH|nr:DUF2207 domain-containing protein [Devosia pacifica]GHA30321.1 hypothetical protein GCM10007989_27570 [Devosia pacifica]
MLVRLLFAIVAFVCLQQPLQAQQREQIQQFHSDITLRPDASVEVVETIEVIALGRQIRRGIFRDVPLSMVDDDGNLMRSAIDVLSVTRDGEPENFRLERMQDVMRLWIGDPDVRIGTGAHRYVIRYTMDRMGRFFADYDEIYWNATGTYWDFFIENAEATVHLPDGAEILDTAGFVGPRGSTDQSVDITRQGDGTVLFEAQRPLAPREGLTVAVSFDKGVLVGPDGTQQLFYWFYDRQDLLLPLAAVLAVLAYFFSSWSAVGRDPPKGTIIPLYHPPKGFSPALVHYVHNWGWKQGGWLALTAAAFNLGVKGLITVDNSDDKIALRVTGDQPEGELPPGEAVLYRFINSRRSVVIGKKIGKTLVTKRGEFTSAIAQESRDMFFKNNWLYSTIGIVLALAAVAGMVWLGYLPFEWLIFAFVGGVFVGVFFSVVADMIERPGLATIFVSVWAVVIGVQFSSMLADMISGIDLSYAVVAAFSIVAITVAFVVLMRAPTIQGRKVMDQIDGLKLYLETAEKERLNMRDEPPMTVERFERLLPYAIALGVEKPWSEHFSAALARASDTGASAEYRPRWYSGTGSYSPSRVAGSMAATAAGLNSAMAAAAPTSSSSSGVGGGGFSGGGGGGGGGGGW